MPFPRNPKSSRSIDAEAGRPKLKSKKPQKKEYISSSEEEDSDSPVEVKKTRKQLVKKPYKEDARRRIFEDDSQDDEEEEETPKQKGKTTKSKVSGTSATAQEEGSVIAAYTALFVAFDAYGIISPRQLALSTFGVSFFALYNIIHGMELALYRNSRVNSILSEYFSLPSRIYYAYMGIYQILRAKIAAGIALPAMQRRIYRRLETELPLESCTIAGPLVPFFQSLGCYKPTDDYYGMIRPKFPALTAGTTFDYATGDLYFFPPVPVMIAFMNSLSSLPNTGAQRNYLSNGGYLIPVHNDGAGTAVNWLGQSWETDATTAHPMVLCESFSRPGLSLALPEALSDLTTANKLAYKRMAFPTVTQTSQFNDVEQYLFFDGSKPIDWLKRCREHATAQAQFFLGKANLGQISATTDSDPTVVCDPHPNAAAPALLNIYEQENSGYCSLAFAGNTLSAQTSDTEFKRAVLNQMLTPTMGLAANNVFPTGMHLQSTSVDGPWFRSTAGESTTANDLRLRYRKSTNGHHNPHPELKSIVRTALYQPNGTHAEPVIIVS